MIFFFNLANLRIRILENTDHRSFNQNSNYQNKSDKINKTVAYFKITDELDIDEIYEPAPLHNVYESGINDDSSIINVIDENGSESDDIMAEKVEYKEKTSKKDDKFRWSFDISNVHCKNNDEYIIFVAVSRIDVDEDMTGKYNKDNEYISRTMDKSDNKKIAVGWSLENSEDFKIDLLPKRTKGTVVYCIRLINDRDESFSLNKDDISYYYFGNVSGICRFVENDLDSPENKVKQKIQLKRFIILNFYGIYNFECDDGFNFNLNERFHHPKSIRRELDYWYTKKDCTDRLLSCIYKKYLLVKQYKEDVQSLEGKQHL
jgi:hypothetical protein